MRGNEGGGGLRMPGQAKRPETGLQNVPFAFPSTLSCISGIASNLRVTSFHLYLPLYLYI